MGVRLKEGLNIENENPLRGASLLPYKLGFMVFVQLRGHSILFVDLKIEPISFKQKSSTTTITPPCN